MNVRRFLAAVFFPALVVALIAIGLLMGFGVPLGAILRLVAFELAFVWLPGWLGYRTLTHAPGSLFKQVVMGGGFGYVIEALAYTNTAALGHPEWFRFYPLVFAAVTLPLIIRKWRAPELPDSPKRSWALAFVTILALVYLAFAFFPDAPLPWNIAQTGYYSDLVWDVSCAAEAKLHWPITDPRVAGEPFYYYTFVFQHLAAASKITGLEIALVLFRFYPLAAFILLVLEVYLLGSLFTGRRIVGLLSVIVMLFIGEADPSLKAAMPFCNPFFADLLYSPTFLFGLLLFIPLIIHMRDLIAEPPRGVVQNLASWLMLTLLLIGGGGAKGTILPVFVGGIFMLMLWQFLWERKIRWPLVAGVMIGALVFLPYYLGSYSHTSVKPNVQLLGSISRMSFLDVFKPLTKLLTKKYHFTKDAARAILPWIGFLPGMIGFLSVRAIGLPALLVLRRFRLSLEQSWLLWLFLVSLGPFLVFSIGGMGQLYFVFYGYVGACVLAAEGSYLLWQQRRSVWKMVMLCAFVPLAIAGALDVPLDNADDLRLWLRGQPTSITGSNDLTKDLYNGLLWVRANTTPKDVLAANNQHILWGKNKTRIPRAFAYSAFAERRVFLEGWAFTSAGSYPEREALNKRVFEQADREALAVLSSKYGVTHLLVDKVHATQPTRAAELGELIFSNPDLDVYKLPPKQ